MIEKLTNLEQEALSRIITYMVEKGKDEVSLFYVLHEANGVVPTFRSRDEIAFYRAVGRIVKKGRLIYSKLPGKCTVAIPAD